jgi:hypothetical protein
MDPMPPLPPPSANASAQVNGPAMGLLVTGIVGALFACISLLMNVLGTGMSALPGMGESSQQARYMSMMSGGVGILFAIIGLGVAGFMIWSARRMQRLEGWTTAVAASVVGMIPCISPCCIIGLPIGIWCLIVLMKPEVKGAFRG